MQLINASSYTQAQRDRLFFIDFQLYFFGGITRHALIDRFGIAPAAATRDLAEYKNQAKVSGVENFKYDYGDKSYVTVSDFTPLFHHDPEQTMAALTARAPIAEFKSKRPLVSCLTPPLLSSPDLSVVSTLSTAIHLCKAVTIEYHSASSGKSTRVVVPHSLVSNGLRWHARLFDRKRADFRDFVLTRIESARLCHDEIEDEECREYDHQWNRMVDLILRPHPNQLHPEAIEADHYMKGGQMTIQVRAAFAGYMMRAWNVDCSDGHTLEGREYQLCLDNREALYGVQNLEIAPGFATRADHSKDFMKA